MSKQRIPRGYRGVRDNPPDPRKPPTPHPTHILLQSSSHQCQWSEKKMTLLHNFSQCVKHTSGKGSIKKKLESLFL